MNIPATLELELDHFAAKAMQTWNVPGLAVAVVKDDRTVLAKGYGVRDMRHPAVVDEHTLFAIGSNTKAFTAAAVGLLVQEGKLAWDDPVTQYLPDFRLYDPRTTQLISIRDLLCHRSGLGTWAGDVLLLSNYPSQEIVKRLRHIPPAFPFRAGYGYSNLMFITAGLVIEAVSGMSWDDFIRTRLFEPLGMTGSVTNPRFLADPGNVAVPHEDVQGSLRTVVQRQDAHIGAAGSIHASVAEMARWMRLQLNDGMLDGTRLIDTAILEEMRTPHTPMRLAPVDRKMIPSRHFLAYGLGWFLSDRHGRFIVSHTGGVDGMLSSVMLVPEEKLGLAVFSNKLPNSAYAAIPNHLLQVLLGLPVEDWIQKHSDLEQEGRKKEEQARQQRDAARAKDTHPSLAWENYAGAYESAILGGAAVGVEGDGLRIRLAAHESISGALEHWHYDTFLCRWDDPVLHESLVRFITDGQGQVAEFRVKIREDWIDPLEHVFRKSPKES